MVNPTRLGGNACLTEEGMEAEHAATCELSLVVDGKQESVRVQGEVEGVRAEVAGNNVIHRLIRVQCVKEQVQKLDEKSAVRRLPEEISLHGFNRAVRELDIDK